jgi:3-oxoacyl-[acyl-carrier-protein] synthase II
MRRVVVTGLGLVTPLGADVETAWANILASKSGAGFITHFDHSDQKCHIACEVKPKDHPWGFDPDKRVDHKVQRQVDPFIIFGIDAAGQALEDAGLTDMSHEDRLRAGCSIGSGIGGLPGIESESLLLAEKGPGRVSPHFVHGRLINLISGQVSIKYGLMGPNHAVVTACSTGAHSIGDAARMIRDDDADVMLAGGAEATICPLGIAGFAQARALCTAFNDEPERASRPYDKDRDGFVMGEGAGVVVLEEYEHAKARGAKIYAEVVGYGLSGDANGTEKGGDDACGYRLHQRSWHIDDGGHDRTGGSKALVRRRDQHSVDELHEIGYWPFARRRRRGRSDILHPCAPRSNCAANAQSGKP